MAYDTGAPRLTATAEVFITVLRNLFGPVFDPQIYRVTIDETTPVGQYIQKLTVADPDGVCHHTFITENKLLSYTIHYHYKIVGVHYYHYKILIVHHKLSLHLNDFIPCHIFRKFLITFQHKP